MSNGSRFHCRGANCWNAVPRESTRCESCVTIVRQCANCDADFTGHVSICDECLAIPRLCADCGEPTKHHRIRCNRCRNGIRRSCDLCEKLMTGSNRICLQCRRAANPEHWSALGRTAGNTRRARKRAAEVVGPVSAATYRTILGSGPCVYCGAPATHVDHVRPLSRGGWEHESNLAPACSPCNLSKGAKTLNEWHPVKVAHAVSVSSVVAAEYARLCGQLVT